MFARSLFVLAACGVLAPRSASAHPSQSAVARFPSPSGARYGMNPSFMVNAQLRGMRAQLSRAPGGEAMALPLEMFARATAWWSLALADGMTRATTGIGVPPGMYLELLKRK